MRSHACVCCWLCRETAGSANDLMQCSGAFSCSLQSRVGLRSSLHHNSTVCINSRRWCSSRPCPSHDNSSRQQHRTVASAAAAASPPRDRHHTTAASNASLAAQRSAGRQSKASVWRVLHDLLQWLVDVAREKFVFHCAAALLLLLVSKVAGSNYTLKALWQRELEALRYALGTSSGPSAQARQRCSICGTPRRCLLSLRLNVAGLQAPLYIKTFVDQALTGDASAAVQSRPEVVAATCTVVSLIFKKLVHPVFSPVSVVS